MDAQKKIRKMQDRLRNAGWRIQWIPWWEPDKPEIKNAKNPLPLLGIVIFIGVFFWNNYTFFGVRLTISQIIAIAVFGLGITMLGVVLSAFQLQFGWKRIEAQCVDREIKAYEKEPGEMTSSWGYRLVCAFRFDGKEYKVTPEPSNFGNFTSKQRVEKYLNGKIDANGHCQLWVNPRNPLQTVFHKKKWWL